MRAKAAGGVAQPDSGSARVLLWHARKTTPIGGARVSAAERRGRRSGPREESGPAGGGFGPREKKKKESGRWAGLKTRKREKSWFSIFEKIQTHSI